MRILTALILLTSYTWIATAQELQLLVGKPIPGKLLEVTSDSLTFQAGDNPPVTFPFKEIASLNFNNAGLMLPKEAKFDQLELMDGSSFKLTQLKITGKQLQLNLLTNGSAPAPTLDIPLNTAFWLLRNADDPSQREEFLKLLKTRGKRDLFVVKTSSGLNPIAGTLLNGSEAGDRVNFEREDGSTVTLPLSRAGGGLIFNHPQPDILPPTVCKVMDIFGNTLFATQLQVAGTGLKVTTVSGAKLHYLSLNSLVKLDFSQGNLLYLSDLSPQVEYSPADKDGPLGEQFSFQPQVQNDRGLFTPEILLDGMKYAKGVSIPRGTVLTYKLDGTFREFKAVAGLLDGNNRDTWALKLTLELDGRIVFSDIIAKKTKSRSLGINIKDAKELKILVEPIGEFLGDQLNLAEARLQK